jgi:hypothetical protein
LAKEAVLSPGIAFIAISPFIVWLSFATALVCFSTFAFTSGTALPEANG